ncbi:MAG: hypothetical protein OIF32_08010 [Campylobacterales bacterium]|nr:hypothetical protein [Campylobacterales bacterium]
MKKINKYLITILFLPTTILFSSVEKKTIEDIIPMTMANIRGHQALYNEGWFIISSSKDAFEYAHQKSILSSKDALLKTYKSVETNSLQYKSNMKSNLLSTQTDTKEIFEKGTEHSKNILRTTHRLGKIQYDFANRNFQKAWGKFSKGNIYYEKRTAKDLKELKDLPNNYYKDIKDDFSNIYKITDSVSSDFGDDIGDYWASGFKKSQDEFQKEYEESGKSSNTLVALVDILQGYGKSIYYGLFKPTAQTAVDATATTAVSVGKAIVIPTSGAISITGRTIESLGLTVYYTTSLGVKVISPTVEAGFLTGVSILSLGTSAITYTTGGTIGAVNQVATTVASPVIATGKAVGKSTVDTGKYVSFMAYDSVSGTSKVIYNQLASGVVLGYNGLTAIPTHLAMGVVDTVVLAYDGPRLVIATVNGEVDGFSSAGLPAGTVVDLQKLQNENNINIKIISKDPKVIENVLGSMKKDL